MNGESSWLADGVKEIERVVGAKIVKPEVMTLPGEKPGTYAIITPGPAGTPNVIEVKTAGPLWHNERLETPEQLARFIESLDKREREGDVSSEDGAIYIGRDSIRFCYDFEDRRDRATVPLTLSQPWKWLLNPTNPMDQRTIVRTLRIVFADCLPAESNLIPVLRKVKWKQDGTTEADLQRGKEALGRSILNEASGMASFPEDFVLTVPVFENVKHTVNVKVALEILPDVQKFEIIPFPNQLHNGLSEVLLRLQGDLAETKVPTFIGAATAGKDTGE